MDSKVHLDKLLQHRVAGIFLFPAAYLPEPGKIVRQDLGPDVPATMQAAAPIMGTARGWVQINANEYLVHPAAVDTLLKALEAAGHKILTDEEATVRMQEAERQAARMVGKPQVM